MLGQGESGDQAFFQTPSRAKGNPTMQIIAIGFARHIFIFNENVSPDRLHQSGAAANDQFLPAAFQPCQSDDLTCPNLQNEVLHMNPLISQGHVVSFTLGSPSATGSRACVLNSCPNISVTSCRVVAGICKSPTSLPARSTTTSSHSAITSSNLCETSSTLIPSWRASSRSVSNNTAFCSAEIPVVGSSRISVFTPSASRRTISNCCRCPMLNCVTGISGSRSKPNRAHNCASTRLACRLPMKNPPRCPYRKFSITVKAGTSSGSCCNIPIPLAIAA